MTHIQKALTFRAASIGDCLMGKYLLENIHAQFPEAKLGIVVGNRADMIRDLFRAYPWLEVVQANRRSPRSLITLWKEFRGSDLVVTQYAGKKGGKFSLWSKLFARLLAKRGRLIGFSDAAHINGVVYDTVVPLRGGRAPADLEREALRTANMPTTLSSPTLVCVPQEKTLKKFGLVSGTYFIVHLFAGNKSRGISPEKKRELVTALRAEFPDVRLVISGGAGDMTEALGVTEHIDATVIAGSATLQELMKLIQESRGVISIDTGVAHMSAQLGAPLVVLHTCLGAHWWGTDQYGADARITTLSRLDLCAGGHIYKDYPDCVSEIAVRDVIRAAHSLDNTGHSATIDSNPS